MKQIIKRKSKDEDDARPLIWLALATTFVLCVLAIVMLQL